eukprot:TRINITY_DN11323_c0_g1_i1.p1 TRINITY_DN11323_c0_g1~~TRINITY_DN11323_c0_g1_i1.p1  ORF type:complete len:125 (+),score=1.95 TRINITY_DN11323_c0_g1_i1:407-781(+)
MLSMTLSLLMYALNFAISTMSFFLYFWLGIIQASLQYGIPILYQSSHNVGVVDHLGKQTYDQILVHLLKILQLFRKQQIPRIRPEITHKGQQLPHVLCVDTLSLIHICRCRRIERCRSRWSPYH